MTIDLKAYTGATEAEDWKRIDIANIKLLPNGTMVSEFQGAVVDTEGGGTDPENVHKQTYWKAKDVEEVEMTYYEKSQHYRLHIDGRLIACGDFFQIDRMAKLIWNYLSKF